MPSSRYSTRRPTPCETWNSGEERITPASVSYPLRTTRQEELMTHFRHAAIAAALLAGAGTASAQTTVITREPVETRTVVTTQPLELSPVQRQTIEYRVGMRVPQAARLYEVPRDVAVEVPAIRSYKYMMVNDRVVLVDPATSEIVADFVD